MAAARKRYRMLNGMNYPGRRVEVGDIVDDIPASSIPWLLRDGHIEEADRAAPLSDARPDDGTVFTPAVDSGGDA